VASVCLASLAALSLAVPLLAPASFVLSILGFVALPSRAGARRVSMRRWLAVVLLVACGALIRFVQLEAVPGIVEAGERALGRGALSHLREIVFTQDSARKAGLLDHDGDGVGSAGFVGELMGEQPLRNGKSLRAPLLRPRPGQLRATRLGPALERNGYLFIVCLPRMGGGFTADPREPVDEEQAERRYVAYAWPLTKNSSGNETYFADQHESILVHRPGASSEPRYLGPGRPPSCTAALEGTTAETFEVWREKRPRDSLPGDVP
jgi:hypothetical protein